MVGTREHREHECVFARESRHEGKGIGKSLACGHAFPPLPGERHFAHVFGIALTALVRGAFRMLQHFVHLPIQLPEPRPRCLRRPGSLVQQDTSALYDSDPKTSIVSGWRTTHDVSFLRVRTLRYVLQGWIGLFLRLLRRLRRLFLECQFPTHVRQVHLVRRIHGRSPRAPPLLLTNIHVAIANISAAVGTANPNSSMA
jgi:hypothetical protein